MPPIDEPLQDDRRGPYVSRRFLCEHVEARSRLAHDLTRVFPVLFRDHPGQSFGRTLVVALARGRFTGDIRVAVDVIRPSNAKSTIYESDIPAGGPTVLLLQSGITIVPPEIGPYWMVARINGREATRSPFWVHPPVSSKGRPS